MLKKMLLLVVAFTLLFVTAGCGSAKAQTWDGSWKADGIEATVKDKQIEVHIVNNGTDALFWKGTFTPASDTVKDETVKSTGDREALDMSMLGSMETVKDFQSKDGKILFSISMMGVKKDIQLEKKA